ncbi:hypothetical protein N0V83_010960 [Neocucurbitaria cava]|uniref:Uncharacterized protein n=1 Tax=Neocucurbitaria cava TaxID=798079 RepID=A0A9W8Y0D0_9PLEO|nr:hypothetical protein N0V83_010960 [Neocucurbitaria cava]
MSFFSRRPSHRPSTPPPDFATTSPPACEYDTDDTSLSWDLLTPPRTPLLTPLTNSNSSSSSSTFFDTETFPAQSYLFPSEQNGTRRTNALHALHHPVETATSLRRHASDLNWSTCRTTLLDAADSASFHLNECLNQVFEGSDVVEMHNRVASLLPLVSLPNMRQLSQTIDSVSDTVQQSIAVPLPPRHHHHRCLRESPAFIERELQGDQWAFARIKSAEARHVLVKRGICREWQVVHNQLTASWQNELNMALAATFTREKEQYGVVALFEMTPVWVLDGARKAWRLELDTGLADIVVEGPEMYGFREVEVRLGWALS